MAVLVAPLIDVVASPASEEIMCEGIPCERMAASPPRRVVSAKEVKPTHRLKVRGDGRCAVRATLCAAGSPVPAGVGDIRHDSSLAALEFIRDTRVAAAEALVQKMKADEDLDCSVRWSFPDESYESFEEWLEAQGHDDTGAAQSVLWHGGGSWTLYGLALLLRVKIVVHVVESGTLELIGPPLGAELVDARPSGGETRPSGEGAAKGAAVVRLASMRADDGTYDHFDVLLSDSDGAPLPPHAQPLGHTAPPPRPLGGAALRAGGAPSALPLLGWAALNVLAVAVYLSLSPPAAEGGGGVWLRGLAHAAQQLLVAPPAGGSGGSGWPAVPRHAEMDLAAALPAVGADPVVSADAMGVLPGIPELVAAH